MNVLTKIYQFIVDSRLPSTLLSDTLDSPILRPHPSPKSELFVIYSVEKVKT